MAAMQRAADMLRAVSHPVRLKLLELLAQQPRTVGDLAATLGQAPNAISQHLSHMHARGILDRRRDGRQVYYALTHAAAIGVLRAVHRYEHMHQSFEGGEAI